MLEAILIISHVIILCFVIYFIYDFTKKQREKEKEVNNNFTSSITSILSFITDENKKMYELLQKTQIEYFKNLEKNSSKQIQAVDKNTKDFLKYMESINKPTVTPIDYNLPKYNPIDTDKTENQIEKMEEEEIPLDQMPRIPIVDGVKIKFEDEEDIFPINIQANV